MSKNLGYFIFGFIATAVLTLAAQNVEAADTALRLSLTDQNVVITNEDGRVVMTVDLVAELKKQHPSALPMNGLLDLKALRFEAKSKLGGGQTMLLVVSNGRNRYVDSQKVETDPELFDSDDSFQAVELQNSERNVKQAFLVVLNPVRLRNVDVILGTPDLVSVLGNYGNFVGGAAPSTPPTPPAKPTPQPKPTPAVQPTPQPTPKPVESSKCIGSICVGKHVYHRRSYWEGVVKSVDLAAQTAIVRFGDSIDGFEALVPIKDLAVQ